VRHREAYQTRHTYATMLLMAGANPAWAAKQLGHSVQVFLKVYSKWIDGKASQIELAKVERFTGADASATGKSTDKSGL
jgi:integrase